MPYALIPEGFELKKVTKQQKDAVDEYFGRERRGSYIEGLLSNTSTPTLLATAAIPAIIAILISKSKEFDIGITDSLEGIIETLFELFVPFEDVSPTGPATLASLKQRKEQWAKIIKGFEKKE